MSAIDREFDGHNVAYNSGDCGFIHIAECEEPNLSYEFNTYLVLKDIETGEFYGVGDSGCSCPTPFENVSRMSELTRLESKERLMDELEAYFHVVLDDKFDRAQRGPMRDAINETMTIVRRAGLD